MEMRRKEREYDFDVVVVGGGMAGICAAIASARGGARTALIHDRPVLGGNASSEIRMHICGASANGLKADAEEGGILHEILLDNKACNDYYNYSIWDNVLLQKIYSQPGLKLFLNTSMQDVELNGRSVRAISCYQLTTELHLLIKASIFIDCTGNGSLAYFAGADYMDGCEGRGDFNEPDAPPEENRNHMGNTLLFKAVDRGCPVSFKTPPWARRFSEDDLRLRPHGNACPNTAYADDIDASNDSGVREKGDRASFACFGLDYGYWWIELPGGAEDYVSDYESVRDELVRCVYGVWDHLKNGGEHGAENYDLQWVGMLPGVRESRRLEGLYILTENDILNNRRFEDAVAYGGWPIDNHAPKGINDSYHKPSFVRQYDGLYTIPYRCYCNAQIENLMQAGRSISATKLAMSSSRVMGTCAVGGQAVGSAAAMCIARGCGPAQLRGSVEYLQQLLLRDDCFIPGVTNHDAGDIAPTAAVRASSSKASSPAGNVINGVSRNQDGVVNLWESDGISPEGESIELLFPQPHRVSQLRLTFDSNFNKPKKITLSAKRMAEQQTGVPVELVKDYAVQLYLGDKLVESRSVTDNHQRLNVIDLDGRAACDRVRVCITATHGCPNARVFEIRVYDAQ